MTKRRSFVAVVGKKPQAKAPERTSKGRPGPSKETQAGNFKTTETDRKDANIGANEASTLANQANLSQQGLQKK